MLLYVYDFVLDVFEGIYLAYFNGSFYGIRNDVGGPCVGLTIRDNMTTSDKYMMHLKDYSHV